MACRLDGTARNKTTGTGFVSSGDSSYADVRRESRLKRPPDVCGQIRVELLSIENKSHVTFAISCTSHEL